MKSITKAFAKGTLATVAAGAMAVASASPAAAQDRHRDRDRDGISAGEVIAGAVVLGGLAAIIASADNDRYHRDYRYDRRGYRGDYRDYRGDYRGGYGYSSRDAVEMCVRAVERYAQRRSGSRAEVYEIRDVDRERRGYEVEGRLAVREGWGRHDRRGWGRHDYRRGYRNDGWDEGRFKCDVRRGRVVDVDVRGIRGL
ncbi:hypothetical protein OZN62_13820 [Aurantiacibacter sp. MUD11]|uniref:hypothetical protein n=1 Tax=Aurantiacibacter sp. MUD11 TaxID=3003265 RepID=UPI0022AA241F|nr:hypothetical protein [Aurantiacibacter sp. MUD11]WAT17975.1 hypothetical protein OZN62_13820 [Aurantiacibacter sp. MUD11]